MRKKEPLTREQFRSLFDMYEWRHRLAVAALVERGARDDMYKVAKRLEKKLIAAYAAALAAAGRKP